MPISLINSRRKLDRAEEHRNALAAYSHGIFEVESNKPGLGVRFEEATSEYVLFVNRMPDLYPVFVRAAMFASDTVHNLRAALDYLVYDLAVAHTKGNIRDSKALQFPIIDKPAKWPGVLRGTLAEIDSRHSAIIEAVQPFNTFHDEVSVGLYFHPLAYLRDWSNSDKHRCHAVVVVPDAGLSGPIAMQMSMFEFVQGIFRRAPREPSAVRLGSEVLRVVAPPGAFPVTDDADHVLPQLCFEDGRPIVGVMKKIADAILIVVERVESA